MDVLAQDTADSMKLDARRAFIVSALGVIVIKTCGESSSEMNRVRTESMQCGCRKVWKWKI
jgi:hypothetical protein